jgi:hypothetical protein
MNTLSLPNKLLAFAALWFFAATQPLLAAPVLTTSAPSSITAGNTFNVGVSISGVTDLYGFQFDLAYDPTLLSATGISEQSFLSTAGSTLFMPGTIDNVAGNVLGTAVTLFDLIPGASGSGMLIEFSFLALADGISPLTLANVLLVDSNNNLISDFTVSSTSLTINSTTIPEPSTISLLLIALAFYLAALCLRAFDKSSRRMASI